MFKTFGLRRRLATAHRHAVECGKEDIAGNKAIIRARDACIRAVKEYPHDSDASNLAKEIFELLETTKPAREEKA